MPRPSRKSERTEEILDAYGRCIVDYGVAGATLERVAEEADLARPLLRHYVGNKEELLDAFLERFLNASKEDIARLFDALPEKNRLDVLLNWLFDPTYSDTTNVNVTNALWLAAKGRPEMAERLQQWVFGFINEINKELANAFPDEGKTKLDAVATGIAAIFFNYESSTTLGRLPGVHKTSRHAAELLITTLNR